jgi:hypothetical protein
MSRGWLLTVVGVVLGMLTVPPASATADEPAGCSVDERLVSSCRPWFGTTANGYPQATE